MAIIRLDCNLNGGDSVTPNNELFYRIYGDVDNYADPIHTTGTALSDANVTVDNDNVIITGVDGTTNTIFKIAAVDGAFNEGVLSDASVESSILFEDDFAGTVIDTVTKWNDEVTDPNITMSQNDKLIAVEAGGVSGGSFADYFRGQNGYSINGGILVITFDVFSTASSTLDNGWNVGLTADETVSDNANNIQVGRAGIEGQLILLGKVGAVSDINETFLDQDWIAGVIQYKLIASESNLSLYRWDGSLWSELYSGAISLLSGSYYPFICPRNLTDSEGQIEFDNVVVTNEDYSTQYPAGYTP